MPALRLAALALLLVLVIGLGPAGPGMPAVASLPTSSAGAALGSSAPQVAGPLATPAALERQKQTADPPATTAPRESAVPWPVFEPLPEPPDVPGRLNPEADAPSPGPLATPAPTRAPSCAPAPDGITAVRVVRSGSRARKVVALTFDDGWNPENTLRVLRILRDSRVNATFLPLGRAIESAPAAWRAVVAAGYPLADHTYDHARLAGRCYRTQLSELTRWQAVVRRVLGTTPLPLMRPPGGAYDRTTRLAATGAGEKSVVLWDVDTRDWTGISAGAIASRALAGEAGSIVLMHTHPANTAAALPATISGYRSRGFEFVTLGTLLGVGGPVPFG